MNNYFSKRSVHFTAVLIALVITLACLLSIYRNASNDVREPSYIYYHFDPDTVLESLAQGSANVFTRQNKDFQPVASEPVETVQWNQMDYFRIADAVHEQFWNEAIDNWKLHFMIFRANCDQIDQGPQQGVFEFYVIENSLFRRSGFEETINIDPSTNSILLKNEGLNARSEYLSSIDISRLKVSVHDAFQIAEDNGGREARLSIENNCSVTALLAPDGSSNGWSVYYFNNDSPNIFEIKIDEFTGEYELIHP